MAIELLDKELSKVAIVDDEPQSRRGYSYTVQDADLEAVLEEGPLGSLDDYFSSRDVTRYADAALCDYRLSAKAYATFSGAELVSTWYKMRFPAVLCTRYEKAQIERIRPLRRWIPVLLTPDELNVDSLLKGLEECIFELSGMFRAKRRPWRAQIHFLTEDEDQPGTFFAELPGWELQDIIRVRRQDLPSDIASRVTEDYRCHARVNLAAEAAEELYICDWESR